MPGAAREGSALAPSASSLAARVLERASIIALQFVERLEILRTAAVVNCHGPSALSAIFCIRSAIRRVTPYGSIRPSDVA
jgi:hypothetical protein